MHVQHVNNSKSLNFRRVPHYRRGIINIPFRLVLGSEFQLAMKMARARSARSRFMSSTIHDVALTVPESKRHVSSRTSRPRTRHFHRKMDLKNCGRKGIILITVIITNTPLAGFPARRKHECPDCSKASAASGCPRASDSDSPTLLLRISLRSVPCPSPRS